MSETPVLYEVRDGAARIVLNRPRRRNALSSGLVNQLATRLADANADPEVRVIVLSGAGEGFCAGADLRDPPAQSRCPGGSDVPFQDVLTAIWRGPKPVIAAVHGAAFAGGLGLVAASDVVLVAEDATFSFSEVRIGVIPAIISVVCLRKLGRHQGMRLFLTGRRFDGREAVQLQLAHRAVPRAGLEQAVEEEIADLRLGGPLALAECKRLVRTMPRMGLDDGFAHAARWSAEMFRGEEAQEGIAAFREKRLPSWAPEEGRKDRDA